MGVLTTPARRLHRAWIGAAAAPVLIHAGSVITSAQGDHWSQLSELVRTQANASALAVESLAIVVGGPLLGVLMTTHGRTMRETGRNAGVAAAAFVLAAVVSSLVVDSTTQVSTLIASHITLFVAALSLTAIGAAGTSYFDHPLDAAACALVCSSAAGCGVLVAGPLVAVAPAAIVNAALFASPVVTTASAAGIDVLRGDLLYRFSPIAHSQFEYPAWPTACLVYATVTVACVAFIVANFNHKCRTSAERITP